ncbi:hypothetical protein MPLB_1500013 [Mesorhizobium sp. ORS 3324]|nr:hypothetical protein MPLB_1500013 [Mesorhizobium sp. ORS 3324]
MNPLITQNWGKPHDSAPRTPHPSTPTLSLVPLLSGMGRCLKDRVTYLDVFSRLGALPPSVNFPLLNR